MKNQGNIIILVAGDDPNARALMTEAFQASGVQAELRMVNSGQDLLDYLCNRGKNWTAENAPKPHLILLDLTPPGLDGHAALVEIKGDSILRQIPVVVLTTSQDKQDVIRSYTAGASSYVTKPQRFDDLVDIIALLGKYWLEVGELPL